MKFKVKIYIFKYFWKKNRWLSKLLNLLLYFTHFLNFYVIGIRCAAHTLQLAIQDALNSNSVSHKMALLDKIRRTVKKLRTPVLSFILKSFSKLNQFLKMQQGNIFIFNDCRWITCSIFFSFILLSFFIFNYKYGWALLFFEKHLRIHEDRIDEDYK